MNILVVGDSSNLMECKQKFGDAQHQYTLAKNHEALSHLAKADVIFDFLENAQARHLAIYEQLQLPIFIDVTFTSLEHIERSVKLNSSVFGFCGLPSFLNREQLEVSLHATSDRDELTKICKDLSTSFEIVRDQVGLVTPRVICMIINEAYFTLQEGTATREDIDIAMKLGTNYPLGPFEWCEKIGIKKVCDLLTAVYTDTGDERYRLCPLMNKDCLRLTT
jgi:3-hydroxybutyryl-CoA dehydrogenase